MSLTSDKLWAEHAGAVLGRAGHQRGGARVAVIEVLARQRCALTALELEDELRDGTRRVGRASVYRILELLVRHRLVQRIEIGVGIARYERTRPADGHHHHLVCERCGGLQPFDDDTLEQAIHRLSARLRFTIDSHDITLHGVCEACQV
jgi:Fur family ferric uptake transcriptional regulator